VTLCDRIRQAKSGREIVAIIEGDPHFESWRDSGSSHRIAKFDGGCSVPIPIHGNRDMSIGTKLSIIRILRTAGLCSL
jgi:predicted RNA binding protein YcfA (HicA-like mRNA interferase family)